MSCPINQANGTCAGMTYTVSPFFSGNPYGTFQSRASTSASIPITLSFSSPITSITATIYDPTWTGNEMTGYNAAGLPVAMVAFVGNGQPGVNTPDTKSLTGQFASVKLTPAASDYVAYDATIVVGTDSVVVSCTPDPVERGATVTCKATLLSGGSFSIFRAEAGAPNGLPIPLTLQPNGGNTEWSIAGPAVFTSKLQLDAQLADLNILSDTGGFTVAPRTAFPSPQWTTLPVPVRGRLSVVPDSAQVMAAGQFLPPKPDSADNLDMVRVATGPNAGWGYLPRAPQVAAPEMWINDALYGQGPWAALQTGSHMGTTVGRGGLPWCDPSALPALLQFVLVHEGATGDPNSHYGRWQTAMQQALGPMLETLVLPATLGPTDVRLRVLRQFQAFAVGKQFDHVAFDLDTYGDPTKTDQQLGCALYYDLSRP